MMGERSGGGPTLTWKSLRNIRPPTTERDVGEKRTKSPKSRKTGRAGACNTDTPLTQLHVEVQRGYNQHNPHGSVRKNQHIK